jgi:hypothetical protein
MSKFNYIAESGLFYISPELELTPVLPAPLLRPGITVATQADLLRSIEETVVENARKEEEAQQADQGRWISEIKRCYHDIIYFAETYFRVQAPMVPCTKIKLEHDQKVLLMNLAADKNVVGLGSRQTGVTTSLVVYTIWRALFHPNSRIGLVADRYRNTDHHLQAIRFAMDNLPAWLGETMVVNNRRQIVFGNGSRIVLDGCNADTFRGLSLNCVLWDNAGYADEKLARAFWNSTRHLIEHGTQFVAMNNGTGEAVNETFRELWWHALHLNHNNPHKLVRVHLHWSNTDRYSSNVVARREFRDRMVDIIGDNRWLHDYECYFG